MTTDRLFISNLAYQTTEDELRNAARQFGAVMSCKIPVDHDSSASRGFGFVGAKTTEDAAAIQSGLDGFTLHGRRLKVEPAKPRS